MRTNTYTRVCAVVLASPTLSPRLGSLEILGVSLGALFVINLVCTTPDFSRSWLRRGWQKKLVPSYRCCKQVMFGYFLDGWLCHESACHAHLIWGRRSRGARPTTMGRYRVRALHGLGRRLGNFTCLLARPTLRELTQCWSPLTSLITVLWGTL